MALIRDRARVRDTWLLLEPGAAGEVVNVPPSGDLIIPLAVWHAQRQALIARADRIGVWLSGDDDPMTIANDLCHFELIAVRFPSFTDGRGYSIARILRERLGWSGELRAIGDVQRDQLHYLMRCGFNAFDLRADQELESALGAYSDFTEAYQAAVDRPLPLFRRRASREVLS